MNTFPAVADKPTTQAPSLLAPGDTLDAFRASKITCFDCKGMGGYTDRYGEPLDCPTCDGEGEVAA